MKKSRRALVFTVPQGRELHYLKIKPHTGEHGDYVGRRWAPFFHAYGYYLPREGNRNPEELDTSLKRKSKHALEHALYENLVMLPLGVNAVLFNMIGSVLWAESESYFAYWDGHVSFGSSHLTAHWIGYGLATLLIKKGLTIWTLPLLLWAIRTLIEFFFMWKNDGFKVTSANDGMSDFRTDHLAHMGGIVAGVLTAWVTRKKRLY